MGPQHPSLVGKSRQSRRGNPVPELSFYPDLSWCSERSSTQNGHLLRTVIGIVTTVHLLYALPADSQDSKFKFRVTVDTVGFRDDVGCASPVSPRFPSDDSKHVFV